MTVVALRKRRPVQPVILLSPASAGVSLTPDEFDRANVEEGCRYELIKGVLVVSPATLFNERRPNEELGRLLLNYQQWHAQGASLDDTAWEHDVFCGENRRRADRVIWCGLGRLPDPVDTPTIAVEFVSAGKRNFSRDYHDKKKDYRRAGVTEYWVFDRFACTLTVSYLKKKKPDKVFQRNDVFTSDLLPGFELPLKRIFELANRWPTK